MDVEQIVEIGRLIQKDPKQVAVRVAETFGISRQAASAKLAELKESGWISSSGTGRGIEYALVDTIHHAQKYVMKGLSEDTVWRQACAPYIKGLPNNVRNILHYGVTEMVNNAIDHSGSNTVEFYIERNLISTTCGVKDLGEGIFLKIQKALNLFDAREAILELAKGKLTTDPLNHTGEGIFFASKMFDFFWIESENLFFVHNENDPDTLVDKTNKAKPFHGTRVLMRIDNDSTRTSREIFDKFAEPDEFTFSKTIVPVHLAQHEGENLVSRSQAKRLTRRFERFQSVVLDFKGVAEIGQGFADELFRVFQNSHPNITLAPINMTPSVKQMVLRVENARKRDKEGG